MNTIQVGAQTGMTRRSFLLATGALVGGGLGGSWLTGRAYSTQTSAPVPNLQVGVQVPPQTATTQSGLRIHAIQTGFVAVKRNHRAYSGPDRLALPAIAVDRQWTEWMPIYAWAIEHPEGVIVIDTGESSQAMDPAYFECTPADRFVYTSFLRFAVTKEDEIGMQLRSLGILPQDVRWVIQTHLHSDHAGGIHYFPHSEFLMGAADYPVSQGALPCHYPDWLEPTLVTFEDGPIHVFERSHTLTRDETISIVPTPGHSLAHQSVLLRDGDAVYFFAGDASFDTNQIQNDIIPGICIDRPTARDTSTRLRSFFAAQPTIYLPSHDPDSGRRLVGRVTVAG